MRWKPEYRSPRRGEDVCHSVTLCAFKEALAKNHFSSCCLIRVACCLLITNFLGDAPGPVYFRFAELGTLLNTSRLIENQARRPSQACDSRRCWHPTRNRMRRPAGLLFYWTAQAVLLQNLRSSNCLVTANCKRTNKQSATVEKRT